MSGAQRRLDVRRAGTWEERTMTHEQADAHRRRLGKLYATFGTWSRVAEAIGMAGATGTRALQKVRSGEASLTQRIIDAVDAYESANGMAA